MTNPTVYTGFWRDYSASDLNAGVLTLPISSASYLVSGLTLLVSLAGTMFWVILVYVWHQSRMRPGVAVDCLDLQIQVLLRNVTSPASAILQAANIYLAWRNTKKSPLLRLLPIVVAASAVMVVFLLSSVFVAAIVSHSQDDILVLAKPGLCGEITANISDGSNNDATAAAYAWTTNRALRAREYAKVWYGAGNPNGRIEGSSAFPVDRLPYVASRVPCPFTDPTRCRYTLDNTSDANTAIAFDTGLLDSASHLGINGPADRALQFRQKTTCMPFRAADLGDQYVDGNETFIAVRAGTYHESENITFKFNEHIAVDHLGYVTDAAVFNPSKTGSAPAGAWQPIPLLARNDSIVAVYVLLANDINYLGPVFDPLFAATGVYKIGSNPDDTTYFGDSFMRMLVCLDQFQFCNPLNGRCTAVTHPIEAWRQGEQTLDLNDHQKAVLWRIEKMFILTSTFDAGIGALGVTGLLANEALFKGKLSPALPSDQWILEVRLWFETALAMLQDLSLGFLDISSFNDDQGAFILGPVSSRNESDRQAAEWQCTGQKVRSRGQVQNFNVVGLVVIVAAATTIVLVGLLLEPCVRVVRAILGQRAGQLRQFGRATDNLYWLLHAALRGSGAYRWKYGPYDGVSGKEVPIINDDDDDQPACFGPPVNADGSWAPFYQVAGAPPHRLDGGRSPAMGKVESPFVYGV